MKYAITAATGKFGQAATNELLKIVPKKEIVLIVRNENKAKKLFPNIEVREASYDDVNKLTTALQNVDRLLFISSQPGGEIERLEQHRNVVQAMMNNNVSFVAYTSFPKANESTSFLATDHRETEKEINSSGIAHSFLRNNWYLENEIGFLQSGLTNHIANYWANNHAGWALEREYAEAAIKVLTTDKNDEVYEFSGPAKTYEDLGDALQLLIPNTIKIEQVSAEKYAELLEDTGLNADLDALFTSFQEPINDGSLESASNDLVGVLGHPLESLPNAIKEVVTL
ncbi:NAD(P)H-binding protein [Leuconostoc suionicum]|uniref:NAD(P)H-binding protein n=1 Tax=Leuconostoc suionicum TaxID=1511761 RepID=UPI00403552D7